MYGIEHESGGAHRTRTSREPGDPPRALPEPEPGWVRIKVEAFGLNRSELHTRLCLAKGVIFPRMLGIECVGVVHAIPEGLANRLWFPLRHTAATWALKNGMPKERVSRMLGHSSDAVTSIYEHLSFDDVQAAHGGSNPLRRLAS